MSKATSGNVRIAVARFESGVRDFRFDRVAADGEATPVEPLELLELDEATDVIQQVREDGQTERAMNWELCQLLVPHLRLRGNGRYLVVERWEEDELNGTALRGCRRDLFARDLAVAQADEHHLITSGQRSPRGSVAELAWEVFTKLPDARDELEDSELRRFSEALYRYLVPEGTDVATVDRKKLAATLERLRKSGFRELGLNGSPKERRELFRKLLAVTLRRSGELIRAVAETLIRLKNGRDLDPDWRRPLDTDERELLDLRYGAPHVLSGINVGYLSDCSPMFADLIHRYAQTVALRCDQATRSAVVDELARYLHLVASFRTFQHFWDNDHQFEQRVRKRQRLPKGAKRSRPCNSVDVSAHSPLRLLILREAVDALWLLQAQLRKKDWERLEALIHADGEYEVAARRLGISVKHLKTQLRQTVRRNLMIAARKARIEECFEEFYREVKVATPVA